MKKFCSLLCPLLTAAILITAAFAVSPRPLCFLVTDADAATLIKYTGRAKRVSVPACLNGKKISQIGPIAFAGNDTIEEIIFPETITFFDMRAIEGCRALKRIIFKAEQLTLTYKKFLPPGTSIRTVFPCLELISIAKIKAVPSFSADFPLRGVQLRISRSFFRRLKQMPLLSASPYADASFCTSYTKNPAGCLRDLHMCISALICSSLLSPFPPHVLR